jgi:alkylation response protein AidB-like acyl-CoA dehydrogenase
VHKAHVVERLYGEIRVLRLEEGASDVRKVIVGGEALANAVEGD